MIRVHDSTLVDRSGQLERRSMVLCDSFIPCNMNKVSYFSVIKQPARAFNILYVTHFKIAGYS